MKVLFKYMLSALVFAALTIPVKAQNVPDFINYQGFITDKDGKALSGDFNLKFSLYDRPEGGDPLWEESHAGVTVENGMFNILLGTIDSTLNTGLFVGKRFLGIKVGTDAEMIPRMQLASVPYSLRTGHSAKADSSLYALQATKAFALDAPDGGPQNAVLVDNEGNVEVAGRLRDKTGFVMPVGTVLPFAGKDTTLLDGWLMCDGSEVSRTEYADLFAVIGVTYGAGDLISTFRLPDLQGRIPVGFDDGQPEFNELGMKNGQKTHTLSTDEMPIHNHHDGTYKYLLKITGTQTTGSVDNSTTEPNIIQVGEMQNAGGNQPHNNLQPYIVLKYIIKY